MISFIGKEFNYLDYYFQQGFDCALHLLVVFSVIVALGNYLYQKRRNTKLTFSTSTSLIILAQRLVNAQEKGDSETFERAMAELSDTVKMRLS